MCKIINNVNRKVNQITRFKFYQKKIGLFDVYLSIRDTTLQNIVKLLFKNEALKYGIFNNCDWNFIFISFDEFYRLQDKNKFAYFENEIKDKK